ncbi:hypothetical protein [Vibrio vulnificus]|uniref:hypothetical protein n=2 Tax=Vibrio vulnificus TaxID=672 RepID=UPI0009278044|nr:hypothetical protein [Vibrio vulnificus]OJI53400.1 hypothetical protein VV1062A_03329 [Vibrio vulnificus]POB28439.1 hypothetical protein CRN47_01935 [Vibrio vulnificus]
MSKFNISDVMAGLNRANSLKVPPIQPIIKDTRSRAERREDFDRRLKQLDRDTIEKLKEDIINADEYSEEYMACKKDVEDALIKFLRFYDEFEDLNSEESRKVALKEQELKLAAKHDWAEKFRLFFFRILASVLFIVSLFTIGYIEKEYEWATLPLSKYVSSVPANPLK